MWSDLPRLDSSRLAEGRADDAASGGILERTEPDGWRGRRPQRRGTDGRSGRRLAGHSVWSKRAGGSELAALSLLAVAAARSPQGGHFTGLEKIRAHTGGCQGGPLPT